MGVNPFSTAIFNAKTAAAIGKISYGGLSGLQKMGLIGLGIGGTLAATSILRSMFQGKSDGAYNAAGNGNGGIGGYSGGDTGTNMGKLLTDPGQWAINSGWALADAITFHSIPAIGKKRLQATSKNSVDIGAKIARGQYDPSFAANFAGDVIGGTLTPEEKAMLAMMDPKDRARYLLQKKMQEKAEMAALCSNLQGLRHQAAMTTIGNIR